MEDNSFNPEQISRMMNMIKMVQMLNNENKSNEDDIKTVNDKNDTVVEELNENINQVNDGVMTIEKAIPYIDPKYQKNLEIMVKIMELQKVINSFSAITIQSKNPEEKSRKMLMAIKPELDNKKQKMLDLFVKVMEIKTIMEGIYGK